MITSTIKWIIRKVMTMKKRELSFKEKEVEWKKKEKEKKERTIQLKIHKMNKCRLKIFLLFPYPPWRTTMKSPMNLLGI